jgi:hypothetical protein
VAAFAASITLRISSRDQISSEILITTYISLLLLMFFTRSLLHQ